MNPTDLARAAGVDVDTASDFVNGNRWPQAAKRGQIARALGWVDEGIDQIVRGDEPSPLSADTETVGTPTQDDAVLASLPPDALKGFSAADRAEVIAASKLSALQTAREIRRRLDS